MAHPVHKPLYGLLSASVNVNLISNSDTEQNEYCYSYLCLMYRILQLNCLQLLNQLMKINALFSKYLANSIIFQVHECTQHVTFILFCKSHAYEVMVQIGHGTTIYELRSIQKDDDHMYGMFIYQCCANCNNIT